jgi:phage baseplate assembly protein V
MQGLVVGTVTKNYDKDHPGAVQVEYASFSQEGRLSSWLPVLAPYAGKDYGIYFLPEKGDAVVVGFLGGDTQNAVVLGSLWNTKNTLPKDTATEKNEKRALITKGGHRIVLTDGDKGGLSIQTKAGHNISIDEKEKRITVATSDGKNTLTLNEKGKTVALEAADKLSIKAKSISLEGDVKVSGKSVEVRSSGKLALEGKQTELKGATTKINGQGSAELVGATVKVEAKAMLTLKGALTKVN